MSDNNVSSTPYTDTDGMGGPSPDSSSNPNHLSIPSSTPQARRKRGLSLRTQLFNKALASNLINPSVFELNAKQNDSIEMSSMSQTENTSVHFNVPIQRSGTPQITIEESNDDRKPGFSPYGYSSTSLNGQSSHLSSDSIASEASSFEFISRQRKVHHRHQLFSSLTKLKNKILGKTELPPTKNGRVIPVSFSKGINSVFGLDLYDETTKDLIDERSGEPYCSNVITSSKYTRYSFLPKQLRAQFSKIANCYFLCVAIMQMIPSWSTTGKFTTIIPLMIFISISIAREGFDDWKRHKHDKEENNRTCVRIKEDDSLSSFDAQSISTETLSVDMNGSEVSFQSVQDTETPVFSAHDIQSLQRYNLKEVRSRWKEIRVGDVIKVCEDEWIPADIVLLSVLNDTEADIAYIETMDLDGETNLKSKFSPPDVSNVMSKASGLKNFNELMTVEDPNTDLYNFEGLVNLEDKSIPLGPDNIVYRGSILRNTNSVLGLVIFTGEETKIRMNNIKNPRTKAPKLQRNINYIVIFMVFVVASLSGFSLMAQKFKYGDIKDKAWYLYKKDAGTAPTLMSFIIMYNTLIPLSLYVTMEIIKLGQLLLLQCDIDMYHAESNTPADAKTATILEELGQVSYIFSDKTGTLTDNLMFFRKFSVNGMSWLHDVDVASRESDSANFTFVEPEALDTDHINEQVLQGSRTNSFEVSSRKSTTSYVRESIELSPTQSTPAWKSTANPNKLQDSESSLGLLKYIQSHPNTLFSRKTKFFLLSVALCSTCSPKRKQAPPDGSLNSLENTSDFEDDQDISYQSSSPDEKALVEAARDLGFVVCNKKNNSVTLKTYPNGFKEAPKFEQYQVLDVIEFSSTRKRMSIIVKFPDNRICVICKGADNVIIERLKHSEMAKTKAKEISLNASERKMMEADVVLQDRFSQEAEVRRSTGSIKSIRKSLHLSGPSSPEIADTIKSVDSYLMTKDESEVNDVAQRARESLHLQQAQRYSLDSTNGIPQTEYSFVVDDRILVNDEYLIEKTLEHVEEFSTEGLRTLLYSFKWMDQKDYEQFSEKYQIAKSALSDRAKKVEEVGESIEHSFDLIGASAIEDKLQDGVSEAIEKLRRAGIKMWMLTGDKRETAINIGYSCRLIKDYSTVSILNIDHGKDEVRKRILSTVKKVNGGGIAHCVVVVDGATLATIQNDEALMAIYIDLCVVADSAICCRASPSQKAAMVSAIRNLDKRSVTLAIGDGANDIAMIQSADIGVGITGKEGLQAARASDYAIAQFRFLLKLLLVNGRYNYVRTSKFVLCTFYKELIFYLTQAMYQRYTLFSGSSVYESWSLSMFNTLFTSLPVLVIGIFDKDLQPATLLAVPELYSKGRLYKGFNLKIFVTWMILAASQSVGISFLSWYIWGFNALKDNSTLPLGTLLFASLVIIINAKCEFTEMQNKSWVSFAAFIISVGGYGVWNVVIMMLYRSSSHSIFYADYGLLEFGQDVSWWASLLVISVIPIYLDVIIKVFKFIIKPNDDEIFRAIEKDIHMRRSFEQKAYNELKTGWTSPKDSSIWYKRYIKVINGLSSRLGSNIHLKDKYMDETSEQRKRAGTSTSPDELPPGSDGEVVYSVGAEYHASNNNSEYEVLPSGKRVKRNRSKSILDRITRTEHEEDIDAIISDRLDGFNRR
ncbi:drs2 neo1 protein [Yamadazyma tenuis]|uniref:Phospholipid-transporting ATPase n=1 Tax=Candida tenuis (strain ATCC 10573 / BCRC 21748 / CBS 615 / JCM 9827 / NBRC 10315 / NRRL Y-1498 / VKM Y-70) TaxID=590646 RepID=G3BF57_CANTC|nr:phospholipid-translocating P-type ATPase [Yamadazyma tenuis ATCC 10573]EGV60643.1 phospholipid-translocating P-type ATPase [Yamadazyma tenuis ATCC 10573]WEJ94106.1 drs2 neo1 protein [Yamadazyma tenuis]